MPVLTAAQQRLVLEHRPLVGSIVRGYAGRGVDVEELYQEGLLGLSIAASRFDVERGVKFGTYAGHWIRALVMEFVLRSQGPVRIGTTRSRRRIFYRLGKVRRQLEAEGRSATRGELAAALGVPLDVLEGMIIRLQRPDVSLDAPLATDDERTMQVPAPGPGPEDLVAGAEERASQAEELARLLRCLDPRELDVVEARYLTETRETLEQLGTRHGVCKERIRQIEDEALRRMRRATRRSMTDTKTPALIAAELRRRAEGIKGNDHFSRKERERLIAQAEKLEAGPPARAVAAAPPPPAAPAPAPKREEPRAAEGAKRPAPAAQPGLRRCSRCLQPGHNARGCRAPEDEERLPEPPAPRGGWRGERKQQQATTTLQGMGPPPAPPVVTGTAQAPGRLVVGNEVVEIRPGDTGEEISRRFAEARAKAAALPTAEDEDPVDAAERYVEARQRSGPGAETLAVDAAPPIDPTPRDHGDGTSNVPSGRSGEGAQSASDEVEKQATPVAENPAAAPKALSGAGPALVPHGIVSRPPPGAQRPPMFRFMLPPGAEEPRLDALVQAHGQGQESAESDTLLWVLGLLHEEPEAGATSAELRDQVEALLAELRELANGGGSGVIKALQEEAAGLRGRLAELGTSHREALDERDSCRRLAEDRAAEIRRLWAAVNAAPAAAAPALPPLAPGQHLELYCGPPRAPRVERLEQGIAAALLALRATGTLAGNGELQLIRDLLTDALKTPTTAT